MPEHAVDWPGHMGSPLYRLRPGRPAVKTLARTSDAVLGTHTRAVRPATYVLLRIPWGLGCEWTFSTKRGRRSCGLRVPTISALSGCARCRHMPARFRPHPRVRAALGCALVPVQTPREVKRMVDTCTECAGAVREQARARTAQREMLTCSRPARSWSRSSRTSAIAFGN
jgi:hypothetical protein